MISIILLDTYIPLFLFSNSNNKKLETVYLDVMRVYN